MIFLSWNVSRKNSNSRLDTLLEIGAYDVICLQEVNADFLNSLRENLHGYSIHIANETLITASKTHHLHLVTLTKAPSSLVKNISHETFQPALYRQAKRDITIEYSFVDFSHGNSEFRVFNSHLQCVAPPTVRANQFLQMQNDFADHKYNIVCGDLNTFARPLRFFIGPALSYSKKDYWINESKNFNNISGFKNPFNKKSTSIYKSGQLDYILLPDCIDVEESNILKKMRNGSDHYPISVKITPPENSKIEVAGSIEKVKRSSFGLL